MAKWTLPEGKLYTQAELDAAVTAALREAADAVAPKKKEPKWRGHWLHGETDKGSQVAIQIRKQLSENILALIPDAGAALDRALAAQRERAFHEGFDMAAGLTPHVHEVMQRANEAWRKSRAFRAQK